MDISTEQVLPFHAAHAMVLGGWAAVKRGQKETGLEQLRDGIDAYRATGGAIELSHWLGLLAEACRDTGRPEEGLRLVGEALQHVNETGVVYYQPELHRLEGELRLCCDARDTAAAENSFRSKAFQRRSIILSFLGGPFPITAGKRKKKCTFRNGTFSEGKNHGLRVGRGSDSNCL